MASPDSIRFVPECRISVGGKVLAVGDEARLTRVEVDLDSALFGQCKLVFHDPRMELINSTKFQSGTAVKVEVGFAHKLQRVFEGEVVALQPGFVRDLPPSLNVVCQESIHRLALTQMTRSLNDVDDKEIVTRIAQEHGLTAEAPSGTTGHSLQSNVTDAVFLRRLAQAHGRQVRIEGKKLIIGSAPKGAEIVLGPASGIQKARVRMQTLGQISEVTVHGWDPKAKREIVGKAKPQGATGKGAKEHGKGTLSIAAHEVPPADVKTAEAMAAGRLQKIAEGFVTLQARVTGDARIVPGASVTLEKLGAQIDGVYRVEKAGHRFDKHGYLVDFHAVRTGDKKPPKPEKAAAAQQEKKPEVFSIVIRLVDPQDQAQPDLAYELSLPDGKKVAGFTGADGMIRATATKKGDAKLEVFPDRKRPPPPRKLEEGALFVEMQVVSAAGEPLAGRAFELTLPDGRVVTGRTEGDGFIRVRSGAEGEMQLRLLEGEPEKGEGQ